MIIFLGMLLLAFGILLGLLLRQRGIQFSLPALQSQVTPASSSVSNAPQVISTADCGSPTLVLGTSTFQIQNLTPAADGSFTVPTDTTGIAYWVEGTTTTSVFVIRPTPGNMTVMSAVSVGSPAEVTWSNCNSTNYSLSAPQAGVLDIPALSDQSFEGITIFFQTDASGAGFVFKGAMAEETFTGLDTPIPDESGVEAEVSLLETSTSPDGKTIMVNISILNYGQTVFTVLPDNISLTQSDGMSLVLVSSKPRLPEKISSGETETFEFSFPRPSSATATLKIFTVEYDIEGY